MSKAKYVLEVCEFINEKEGDNGWLTLGTKIKHIGYMKGKFKTKKKMQYLIMIDIIQICVL